MKPIVMAMVICSSLLLFIQASNACRRWEVVERLDRMNDDRCFSAANLHLVPTCIRQIKSGTPQATVFAAAPASRTEVHVIERCRPKMGSGKS